MYLTKEKDYNIIVVAKELEFTVLAIIYRLERKWVRSLNLAVIGINHKETPIEIREQFSFTESKKIEAGNSLLDGVTSEVVILSTCNRSEVYIVADDIDRGIEDTINMYKCFFKVEDTEDYLLIKKNKDAIVHLYMVASGLDSAVLGEDQILGQVKDAIMSSMELNFSKKVLNKLFQDALNEGKKIRNEIKISEVPLSTSYIGINLVKEELGSLDGKKALIIGAGEISKLSVTYLVEENMDKIYVTNRTHSKIKSIFDEFEGLTPVEYEDRYKILKEVDILVTATGAPHTIVRASDVRDLENKLCILDLALPRDVESDVEDNQNITLYQLDDLNKMSKDNMEKRERLSKQAEKMIENDVNDFYEWLDTIKVDPILQSLHERCLEIKDSRMDYINRKLDLDNRQMMVIDKMLMSALKGLVREPIKTLKSMDKNDIDSYINTMNDLFRF